MIINKQTLILCIGALALILLILLSRAESPRIELDKERSNLASKHDTESTSRPETVRSPPILSPSGLPPHIDANNDIEWRSRIDHQYSLDSPDGNWSLRSEEKIIEAAAEPALEEFGDPEIFVAHCASKMCRIQMTFQSSASASASDWAELFPVLLSGVSSRAIPFLSNDASGRHVVIYLARPGYERYLD